MFFAFIFSLQKFFEGISWDELVSFEGLDEGFLGGGGYLSCWRVLDDGPGPRLKRLARFLCELGIRLIFVTVPAHKSRGAAVIIRFLRHNFWKWSFDRALSHRSAFICVSLHFLRLDIIPLAVPLRNLIVDLAQRSELQRAIRVSD